MPFRWLRPRSSRAGRHRSDDILWWAVAVVTYLGLVFSFVAATLQVVPPQATNIAILGPDGRVLLGLSSTYLLLLGGTLTLLQWRNQILDHRLQRQRDKSGASGVHLPVSPELAVRPVLERGGESLDGTGLFRAPLTVVASEQYVHDSLIAAVSCAPTSASGRADEESVRHRLQEVVGEFKPIDVEWDALTASDCALALMIIEETWHAAPGDVAKNVDRLKDHMVTATSKPCAGRVATNRSVVERENLDRAIAATQKQWPDNPNVVPYELEEAVVALMLADPKLERVHGAGLCRIHLELLNLQRLGIAQRRGLCSHRIHAEVRRCWLRLRDQVWLATHAQDEDVSSGGVEARIQLDDGA